MESAGSITCCWPHAVGAYIHICLLRSAYQLFGRCFFAQPRGLRNFFHTSSIQTGPARKGISYFGV